ncbi:MAG: hypothetical protein HQL17_07300 [Candidatus Omnitrophica bacterium]|nr:hypothetical protein [Candidatus Omnitrophota bacterium]
MNEPLLGMISIQKKIASRFPAFGTNKCQEIGRLVSEISKREDGAVDGILTQIPVGCKAYPAVKDHLLKRRFPEASARGDKISEVFSSFEIDATHAVSLMRLSKVPAPKRIFIESAAEGSELAMRLRQKFASATTQIISSYKEFSSRSAFDIPSYNRRTDDLYIVHEKHDHFKACPCSPGVVPCGYHNVNLGFGCPFECSYCFLQNYTNAPGIVLPANLDDFLEAFKSYKPNIRVGSGETTDSLVYDDLTGYAARIVEFFRSYPQSTFEFKTKSDNIHGLLSIDASPNIVVGWSLNPQDIIDREEYFTASLAQRLDAAHRCAAHGYRVAFHFDPVVYSPGWDAAYADVVERMFNAVPAQSIAWISVGTLRMTRQQKKTIENRFPKNKILDAELFTAEDGKLRYAKDVRLDIYRKMITWLDERAVSSTLIYLCMETESIWKVIQDQRQGSKHRLIPGNG